MNQSSEIKRYGRYFIVAMIFYAIFVFIATFVGNRMESSSLRPLIALLPILPTIAAVYFQIKMLQHMDELQKRISTEAWAISALTVGMLTFSYGFLELVNFPKLPTFLFFPLLIALWGALQSILCRRYQ